MRKLSRWVVAVLALSLSMTVPAAAQPEPVTTDAALDVDRTYHFVGSPAETETMHRKRLMAGPKGAALERLAEDRKYVVETPASKVPLDENAPQVGIDPVSFDECEQRYSSSKPYWYKNKYNSCRAAEVQIDYFDLKDGQWIYVGSSFLLASYIGVAQDQSSTILWGVRLKFLRDVGQERKFATTLTLAPGCLVADQSQSTCTTTPPAITKTVGQWQIDGPAQPAWFTSTITTTSVPAGKYAAEKRAFFSYDMQFTTTGENGIPHSDFTPAESMRCDAASYVNGSRCVFQHVASSLSLNANDPTYGQSATFIRDAQTNITSTKPGLAGKKVPGRANEEALHRLYKDYDTERDIDGSRRKVRKTCRHFFGVDYTTKTGTARQCDEYPFATTYENSARVDESALLTYAVRAIDGTHNETAGRIYGNWLGIDHILDGDPFFIIIR